MTQHMLLFSLGPVQSFISQARKTRDLWLGSFLLSALMQASMEGIETTKLVFPYKPFIEKQIPDLPNKYIAIFDTSEQAIHAARQSEENIKQFWQAICNDVWCKVLERPARFSPSTLTQWKKQTDPANVFEIFWVVVEETGEDYKDWLKETQRLFDGRKYLRDFNQQEEAGEKSTISGQRAALRGAGELRSDVQMFWYHIAKELSSKDISTDGTERLDAIDTVKRFAFASKSIERRLKIPLDSGYPSTSSIAVATFVERLIANSENPPIASALSTWLEETGKLGETMPATIPLLKELAMLHTSGTTILERDGDCFFPETFSEKRLEKEFGIGEDRRKQLARSGSEAVGKLLRTTDKLTPPITRPMPYYAMIQMDGDKMGSLINGVSGKEEHRNISAALSDFSRKYAPTVVESSYPGRLIYAGGDDVFALAPLARDSVQIEGESEPIKTVLDLVDKMQQQYRMIVQPAVKETSPGLVLTTNSAKKTDSKARKELVTASTGIAIAHHYTSLSYVRRMSKAAEQLAKEHYGRNALVVTVLRRSGAQTRVGCHWQYKDPRDETQLIYPIPLFLSFYGLFKEDVLSQKCVYTLLEEAPTLVALERDAQSSEIKRVLRRQRNPEMKEKLSDEQIKDQAEHLTMLAEAMDNEEHPHLGKGQQSSAELHTEGRRYGLVEVLGWLLVMLFLTRKEPE